MSATLVSQPSAAADRLRRGRNYARRYWMFAVPAAIVVAAVIVFPWIFTLFM